MHRCAYAYAYAYACIHICMHVYIHNMHICEYTTSCFVSLTNLESARLPIWRYIWSSTCGSICMSICG